jgi:hypothetical protein
MKLKYGLHKGKELEEVPKNYLEYLSHEAEETRLAVSEELRRRELAENATAVRMTEVVEVGAKVVQETHEKSGDTTAAKQVLAAKENLLNYVKWAKR